jgi:YesN/AraC family two-component response regulator
MNKITLIIIDDDFSSRNTIKNFLKSNNYYFLINDFSNAAMALEWLKENKVDIALCDMNMPNIDGIEFITQALRLCPDLHFLAISAYSDFRYLRECIVNSVDDYLLKHELTIELLINTLDKIKEKYKIKASSSISANTFHIIDQSAQFTSEGIKNLIEEKGFNFAADSVIPMIISPDYNNELFPDYTNFCNNIVYAIRDLICNVLDYKYSYLIHINPSFQFALLISFPDKTNNSIIQNKIKSLSTLIKDKALRLFNVTLTTGYYPAAMKLENAFKFLDCIKTIRENKLYLPKGSSFILGEINNIFFDAYKLPPYIKEQLKNYLGLNDLAALKEFIHTIFINLTERRLNYRRIIEICEKLCEIITAVFPQNDSPSNRAKIDFRYYEFIGQFEKRIIDYINDSTASSGGEKLSSYSPAIFRALSYIDEHYREQISLESCAGEVGMSYAHLSRIFKKETSLSFSEYLNHFRVSRAKILLAEKKMTIKQIVDETGFANYNYFFRVFKDVEKLTPAEYTDSANK